MCSLLDLNRKIYVFADVQHVLKNKTQASLRHGAIQIPNKYKTKYYEKMRVRNSFEIINPDVASALRLVADCDETKQNFKTTAWVIETISHWHRTMTSRSTKLALSIFDRDKLEDDLKFLKENILFFDDIQFVTKGTKNMYKSKFQQKT